MCLLGLEQMSFTVGEGGAGHDPFEGLCEMAVVIEAAVLRNVGDGAVTRLKQLACGIDADALQIFNGVCIEEPNKAPVKLPFGYAGHLCKFVCPDRLHIVFVDIGKCLRKTAMPLGQIAHAVNDAVDPRDADDFPLWIVYRYFAVDNQLIGDARSWAHGVEDRLAGSHNFLVAAHILISLVLREKIIVSLAIRLALVLHPAKFTGPMVVHHKAPLSILHKKGYIGYHLQ